MKTILLWLVTGALTFTRAETGNLPDATGMRDACVAATLLSSVQVPNRVVILHSANGDKAGCVYRANGDTFLYTMAGTALIDPGQLSELPLEVISRFDVEALAGNDRDLENGCMVYATCAFARDQRDPDVAWAGIVEARIHSGDGELGALPLGTKGHAITAFETKQREVFLQTDGGEPRKLDDLSRLARSGDQSWYDAASLIYHGHPPQGTAQFEAEYGEPK